MTAPTTTSTGPPPKVTLDFQNFHNVIGGELRSTTQTTNSVNPANLESLPSVPVSTINDIETAILAARAAFKTWKLTTVDERQKRLSQFADALSSLEVEFGHLLTSEQGKPTMHARHEVQKSVEWLRSTATLDLPIETIEDNETLKITTRYVPLGVVIGIVPWNFPMVLLIAKLAPAVLAGNTIILKPSPYTPYCGLKLVELAQHFFPPGVIQALSGDDSLGPQLTSRADIDKISFTGSTATGKRVMESASKNLTRVTLELGGNDAAIVCAEVDIPSTAARIAQLAFLNSGQVCCTMKRVYVHSSIYDTFLTAFTATVKSFKVGSGSEPGTSHGPVQNAVQFARVKDLLEDIRTKKQQVPHGGSVSSDSGSGYFVQPTIVDDPADDSRIVREEPFGPIVPILRWNDEVEVIARANDSKMGLAASVWSRDTQQAKRIAESLEAGTVWTNTHFALHPMAPFSGHKNSGIGSEFGLVGLKGFCNLQTFTVSKL